MKSETFQTRRTSLAPGSVRSLPVLALAHPLRVLAAAVDAQMNNFSTLSRSHPRFSLAIAAQHPRR
jgi:hypothetical protein